MNDGEEIVVNGTFTVDAASQLAGKPSMMNVDGGKETVGHESINIGDKGASISMDNTSIKTKRVSVSKEFQ